MDRGISQLYETKSDCEVRRIRMEKRNKWHPTRLHTGSDTFCFIYKWPAGKGLTFWLSFVVYNWEFVTFPLVSWVMCGT